MTECTLQPLQRVGLDTERIGRQILWVRSTGSTNDLAWVQAGKGAKEGMLVLAEEQTAGRGRFGRVWMSPAGHGILCSVILQPDLAPEKAAWLTTIAALSVRQMSEEVTEVSSRIRWPNDVTMGGRKVAGVLVESRTLPGRHVPTYVVGMGVNVSTREQDFPPELRKEATSLEIAAGRVIDRLGAVRRLMELLDSAYVRLCRGETEQIAVAWREGSEVVSRRVEICERGAAHRGTVQDLDPSEGIFLRLDRGGIRRFRSEHVEALRLL